MGEPAFPDDDFWAFGGEIRPVPAPPSEEEREEWKKDLSRTPKKETKATYANLCIVLRHTHGKRLTYNEMAETPYLDGAPLSDMAVSRTREHVERTHGLEFNRDNIQQALYQIAGERAFHPIQGYLRGLVWDGQRRIERVAEEILHVDPAPLDQSMIRKWLVSAVARALSPGCKVDTALVLCGPQGYRKSMFFDILGGQWFCDTNMDITTVKGLMQLAAAWIYEWAELERVIARRHTGDVKGFVTTRVDKFVPPYGRGVIEHARSTVIVGTTNEETFLGDPTGSRRFWILRIKSVIDTKLLRAQRDQLWAEAVHLYQHFLEEKARGTDDEANPYRWWLTEDEEKEREARAKDHQVDDPWERPIVSFLQTWFSKPRDPKRFEADILTTRTILTSALGLETRQQGQAEQNRVRSIMLRLGYVSSRRRWPVGGKAGKVWLWLTREQAELPEVEGARGAAGADSDFDD